MFKSNKQRILTYIVFSIYLFLLTWLVLFKLSVNIDQIIQMNFRSINLIPFYESTIVNGKVLVSEIIFNILVFVPLGVYICILKPNQFILYKIMSIFMVSFVYEFTQFVIAIGASDITDLIGNTLGGVLGIGLFYIIQKLFKQKSISVVNGIGFVIEVIAFCLIIFLAIVNR